MKYTFLLPAYKARFLNESLRSLQSQIYKDFNVIISDDCSPEDLYSICFPYLSDSRFMYRRNETNMGSTSLISHWNYLVNFCVSDYFILASDDDIYGPTFLQEVDRLVSKYPQVDLIRAKVRNITAEGMVCREEKPRSEYLDHLHFLEQMFCTEYYNCIQNFAFKTKPFQQMGGFVDFPLAMNSDDATTIMMSKNGVATIRSTTFDFRLSGMNISYPKKDESISIKIQKIQAANMFCVWTDNYCKSQSFVEKDDAQLWNDIQNAMRFYVYCCTSTLLFYVGFKDFFKEYIFMIQHRVFPNTNTQFRIIARWVKSRILEFFHHL